MIIHDVDQRSEAWRELRRGIPTASEFSQLLTPKTLKPAKTDYAFQLAAEYLGADNAWLGNAVTDHGIESEDLAHKAYTYATGRKSELVGFVTNDDKTAGCSPDALVGDDGMLEIKAPFGKNMVKLFCSYIESGAFPPEHHLQVQGQMMICERKWCDLILFHPDLEPKIIRVKPDLEIHAKLQERIDAIIIERDRAVETMRAK